MADSQSLTNRAVKNFDCDPGLAAGDLVYLSIAVPNKVLKASDNNTPTPVIGLVLGKATATTAKVLLYGLTQVSPTISQGRIYVGPSGEISLSVSLINYHQPIGRSFGDGTIELISSIPRVKRS